MINPIVEIRTVWGWLRGDCIECGHSHYSEQHHTTTQSCPRIPSCNCYDYENLARLFFEGGLKGLRKRHEMRRRIEDREIEQLRKQREQRERQRDR